MSHAENTESWGRGYPVHEVYPPAWHGFQSPAHLQACCALKGVAWDVGPQTPLTIAEVGCGIGYTALVLAAGNPHWRVIGLDYNPAHIAQARAMAAAAGIGNASFIEADIGELEGPALDRLPEFDLVTAHGLWSWVGDPVREGLLRLIRQRLKPGGLALVSYNALPGAAGAQGLAKLVRAELLAAPDSMEGLARAGDKVRRLVAAEPVHLPVSSWRRVVTGESPGARPGYLLHEFLTEHWRPSFHSDVASAMAGARCDYVGSASLDENFPQFSLTAAQQELWGEAPDSAARELLFDLCVPRAFRRDVFVRGLRRVPVEAAVGALRLISTVHGEGELKLRTQAGEASLPRPLVDTVRTALASRPHSVDELRSLPACAKTTAAELFTTLVASGCAQVLWREPGSAPDWAASISAARRLNAVAAQQLASHGAGRAQLALAAPALGGGLPASTLELGVVECMQGLADADTSAAVAAILPRLLPPGPPPPREVLDELGEAIQSLLVHRRPTWRALELI